MSPFRSSTRDPVRRAREEAIQRRLEQPGADKRGVGGDGMIDEQPGRGHEPSG
jgi:hypothetical protein